MGSHRYYFRKAGRRQSAQEVFSKSSERSEARPPSRIASRRSSSKGRQRGKTKNRGRTFGGLVGCFPASGGRPPIYALHRTAAAARDLTLPALRRPWRGTARRSERDRLETL